MDTLHKVIIPVSYGMRCGGVGNGKGRRDGEAECSEQAEFSMQQTKNEKVFLVDVVG